MTPKTPILEAGGSSHAHAGEYAGELRGDLLDKARQLTSLERSKSKKGQSDELSLNVQADTPFVSIIIPMLDEEKHIVQCLETLLQQDYPRGRYEILVIDGCSVDASSALVSQAANLFPQIRMLRNPGRIAAKALNIGLREARGDIVARMDAHALAPPNYISTCVKYLLQNKADNVGGIMKAEGRGLWGRSIALGTSCPFGVGNSKHRCSDREGYDEAGWLGAFWKATLLAIGGYNELVGVNEDDELNYRLLKKGGKVFRTPEIKITYICRQSLINLWIQYFSYGYWKVKVIQNYGRLTDIRHVMPSVFVIALIVSLFFGFVFQPAAYFFLAVLASYASVSTAYAMRISYKAGWFYILSLPIVFAILHFSYGIGFCMGLLNFLVSTSRNRVANQRSRETTENV